MKSMTSECLAAAGITKVVWIDDFFASPSRDALADAVIRHAEQLREQGNLKVDFFTFAGIDLTLPKGEVEDACIEIMEGMSEAQLAVAVDHLATLPGMTSLPEEPQPDLSPDDFKQLREAFGSGLRTFSLGTWTSAG